MAATSVLLSSIFNLWVSNISSTVAVNNIASFKINLVELWSAQFVSGGSSLVSSGAFSGVGLEWFSTQGQNKIVQDYGDINRPAHVRARPPPRSLAGDWYALSSTSNQSVTLFRLFGSTIGQTGVSPSSPLPPGTIVDVHTVVTVLNVADGTTPNVIATSAGLFAGGNYFRGLDGLISASSSYRVVGYPQA